MRGPLAGSAKSAERRCRGLARSLAARRRAAAAIAAATAGAAPTRARVELGLRDGAVFVRVPTAEDRRRVRPAVRATVRRDRLDELSDLGLRQRAVLVFVQTVESRRREAAATAAARRLCAGGA